MSQPPASPRLSSLAPVAGPDAGASPVEPHPVDLVAVVRDGTCAYLEPVEWMAMSRAARLDLIEERAVIFLHHGERVPLRPALLHLRNRAADIAAGIAAGIAAEHHRGGFARRPA